MTRFDHIRQDYKKMLKEEEKIYHSVIKKKLNWKKSYIEALFLLVLGALSSIFSSYNFFYKFVLLVYFYFYI